MAKSLLMFDGFGMYGSQADFDTQLGTANSGTVNWKQTARQAGTGFSINSLGVGSEYLEYSNPFGNGSFPATKQIWFIAFGHKPQSSAAILEKIVIRDGASDQLRVRVNHADGSVDVQRGDNTVLATSSPSLVVTGVWQQWSMMLSIADAGGRAKIELDGVEIINFTGDTKNTANAFGDALRIRNGGFFDDLIVMDGLTSDALIPAVVIPSTLPNADHSVNYTRTSGANNFETIDEGATPNDTDYNHSATLNDEDLFDFGNLSNTVQIFGTRILARQQKSTAGVRKMRFRAKPVTTVFEGIEVPLFVSSFRNESEFWELDPQTAVVWTEAGLNASRFGYKVST